MLSRLIITFLPRSKYLLISWLQSSSAVIYFIDLSNFMDNSVQFSCSVFIAIMDCSRPSFPVHHQVLELIQTHVHQVDDAIQPSRPLSSSFPPAFNLAHHQDLFQGVSSSHQVAKVLELQLQHQPFQ